MGTAQVNKSVSQIVQNVVILPCPPPEEQHAVAAFLDRETARIDVLIAKVREAIERLKEYRTALISAAVTGKIDVRDAASSGAKQSVGYAMVVSADGGRCTSPSEAR